MCDGVFLLLLLNFLVNCSSGDRVDICFMQMLLGMSLTPLHIVPDSGDISDFCFPPGGVAVGQAEITAAW